MKRPTFRPSIMRACTRTAAALTILLFTITTTGCFNTYRFTQEEFAKVQRPDEVPMVIETEANEDVVIDRDTKLYVRSNGGRRYTITAFNFKLTKSQLVASDRDTLLMTSDLQSYEADFLSEWQTALVVIAGVAALGGVVGLVVYSAQDKANV